MERGPGYAREASLLRGCSLFKSRINQMGTVKASNSLPRTTNVFVSSAMVSVIVKIKFVLLRLFKISRSFNGQ